MERYGADMIKRYIFGFALVVVGGFLSEYPEFMHKISKMIHKEDKTEIIDKINQIKFGSDIQSYKTGSVNGVKTRIRLFTEGVEEVVD